MANVQQASPRNMTAKELYNYDPSTPTTMNTKHNTDSTHTLKVKTNAAPLRFPYSSVPHAATPGTTTFRVSVQEFRDKLNKRSNRRPMLKQAQTDNYYNTSNASLTHHAFRAFVDTDTAGQITESEDESESMIFTNAYSQYQKADISQFPDTHKTYVQNKMHAIQHKMGKLQQELAIKSREIHNLTANNNMNTVQIYSDGDIIDEGMATDDDDSRDHTQRPYWINKKKYTKPSNTNMKMSELFKETADTFLVFLKRDELQKESQAAGHDKYALKLCAKIEENKQLTAENVKLKQQNSTLNDKILQLNCELNAAENKIKEFENMTAANHKQSALNKLYIYISGVLGAIDNNNTNRELSEDEVELYELIRSFIDSHQNKNDLKYSPSIENECEIISFDNFETPISIKNDLSINSNESTPSLTMDVVSNSALENDVIPNENVKFNDNQSKSESYWKRKNKINSSCTTSRHRTSTVSKTHCIKPKFDFSNCDLSDLSFAALSNLPHDSEELIRTLSHQTNVSITSTHRMRTEKPKHKHKRKHKSAKIRNSVYPIADNEQSKSPRKCEKEKIKTPVFADITSWRKIMDGYNNERVENATKLTPTNSDTFFENGNGVIKIQQTSLTKITELLHK